MLGLKMALPRGLHQVEKEGNRYGEGGTTGELWANREERSGTLGQGPSENQSPLLSHPQKWLIRSVLMNSGEPRTGWRQG